MRSTRRTVAPAGGRCAATIVLLTTVACGQPLVFPDWTLPLADDVPVIEYAHVPAEDRTQAIAHERDLVVEEAFGLPLYQPRDVEVATDGRIFVLDGGNHRVVSFAPDGTPLAAFGQEGQGPGEFQSARNLGIVAGEVVVWESRNVRFSRFDLDGNHIADHALGERVYPSDFVGFDGDMFMIVPDPAFILPPDAEPEPTFWRAGLFTTNGEQLSLSYEFPYASRTQWSRDRSAGSVPLRSPFPLGALGDGVVYVTDGAEYQVRAIEAGGDVRWALRTDYAVPAVPEEAKRAVVEQIREYVPDLTYDDFTWPQRFAAIEKLNVDGAGNLFVFPHANRATDATYADFGNFPIDVYSPAGDRLFTGSIEISGWDAALGEHVYRVETDPETGEEVVARYSISISR